MDSDVVPVREEDRAPLRFGTKIRCPWCETWDPKDAYTQLQSPPHYSRTQCPPIYKHGGISGCKKLFALYEPVIEIVQNGDGAA